MEQCEVQYLDRDVGRATPSKAEALVHHMLAMVVLEWLSESDR